MSATCVMTFRASCEERVRNLRYVLRRLDAVPGLATLVVEQDAAPTLDAADLPASCRTLFVRNDGVFNKSWGLNVGVRAVEADVVALSDADILVNRDRMHDSLKACADDYDMVRPWSDIVDLTEHETVSVIAGAMEENRRWPANRFGRDRVGEHATLCGGVYVVKRTVYIELGGQDERFFGWGGEDDAMSVKVAAICTRVGMLRDSVALHLNHPRHASLPVDDPYYQRNVALLHGYQRLSRGELVALCERQRQAMGDPERFHRS